MEHLEGHQPRSSIHHRNDGFFYLCYKHTDTGVRYLRCTEWRQGCLGRAILQNDNVFQLRSGHDHGPDFSRIEILRQRTAMLVLARSQPLPILDMAMANNMNGIPINRNLSRTLNRARAQTLPTLENLASLREVLENPLFAWLTTLNQHGDSGFRGSVQTPNGSQVLLFLNQKCEDFLKIVTSISLIKSSSTINNHQHTVITVASMWNRNVIPLAWLLFESSNLEAFLTGFSFLKTFLTNHQFRKVVSFPDEVVVAFNEVFPAVKMQPSIFDYVQELKTNVELVHCVTNLLLSPAGVQIMKMCCAISLLPKDMMQIGLNRITVTAHSAGEEIFSWSQQLFNFINREWLQSPTFQFNLCGDFQRSHYGIEIFKLKIERDLASCNNFYSITRYIMKSLVKSQQKINAAVCGLTLRSSVPKPITEEIQFWNLLNATGFPVEMKVMNILVYVSEKLLF